MKDNNLLPKIRDYLIICNNKVWKGTYVINGVNLDTQVVIITHPQKGIGGFFFDKETVVPKEIYESPLYQALGEE